jgi:hypothetical protein
MKVSEAGNTIIPAYLTLVDKGYKVERVLIESNDSTALWRAVKANNEFNASDPLTLLGIVAMAEHRGEDWKPKMDESQEFIEKYLNEKI